MKFPVLTLCLFFFAQMAIAQNCEPERYLKPVFANTLLYQDLEYSKDAPEFFSSVGGAEITVDRDMHVDVRVPIGDTLSKRPCIIWAHAGAFLDAPLLGGTFVIGDKEADDMVALIDSFARRGYVAASIQYRLGIDVLDETSGFRAVYRAAQDGSAAVRYFKENADVFNIDTNFVFFAGSSAGALAGTHLTYVQDAEVPTQYVGAQYNFLGIQKAADLGTPDSRPVERVSTLAPYTSTTIPGNVDRYPAALVSCWGAIGDTTWINGADDDVPAVMFHGLADAVVDPYCDEPFSGLFVTPEACGGAAMTPRMVNEGIEHVSYLVPGEEHIYWGGLNGDFIATNPMTPYFEIVIGQIGEFLYDQMKPADPLASGPTAAFTTQTSTYSVPNPNNSWFCWDVVGGTVVSYSTDGSSIDVLWDQGPLTAAIQVTEITCTGVHSETVLLNTIIDLIDTDMDGVPDINDICPGFDDNLDTDLDGVPNGCDVCPNAATDDSDGDGVCDDVDICAGFDDNVDADLDNVPDGCDICPNAATDDSDGDGVCDDVDICAGFDDNVDTDLDNVPDGCDVCPNAAMDDSDGDGVCDDVDICVGFDDNVDTDLDNVPDGCDVCPNAIMDDSDGDGVCDDLDVCPGFDDNLDSDMNGVPDDCDAVLVELRILLEGALIAGSQQMRLNLNTAGLIPLSHPYSLAPYNSTATATIVGVPSTVVDWVLVEARSGTPNATGPVGTTVEETQVGFVDQDGFIIAPSGVGGLRFSQLIPGNDYHFVVRHRNHLDVMTAAALSTSGGTVTYDFNNATAALGIEQMKDVSAFAGSPTFAMHAGEYNQDGVIQNTDFDEWVVDPSILNTYSLTDGNLDGTVQTTDYDTWFPNKAKIGASEIQF